MPMFTEYPIKELGDTEYKTGPMREVEVIREEKNGYVRISVGGIERSLKAKHLQEK